MHLQFQLVALCVAALTGCGKAPTDPPVPAVKQVQIETTASGTGNTSVPPAESVLTPTSVAKPDPAGGRSNNEMSRAQESSAMPLPGQNNDHSAPLAPAKGASRP